jgi:N-formylglutamate deformylase
MNVIPGSPDSGVILHVPHSSRRLPPDARSSILLDDAALAEELDYMTDAYTDLIATGAADRAWLFVNPYSRLAVDPERFPDEREEMASVGMGAVYTRTSHGAALRPPLSTVDLMARYYTPYADAMAGLVDDRLAAVGHAVILDVHSYPSRPLPYELHGGTRPAVCLGTDSFHTPPWLVEAASVAFATLGDVGLDTPFAGCYVPLRHYRRDARVSALMVEVRRDVYMHEPGGLLTPGVAPLIAALARVLPVCDR